MKILIIGAGFLGTSLKKSLSKEHEVAIATLNPKEKDLLKLDATNQKDVEEIFERVKPEVVIHTVSLTSSIACEKNPELAKNLIFETTKNVAMACQKFNSKMLFISSSYLFDGKNGQYSEEEKTNSTLVYSKNKIMAEKEVLKISKSVIIRVDIMYGYNGKNEKNSFLDSILKESEIFIGNPNQIRSPVLLEDVGQSILKLIEKDSAGIFNIVGDEKLKHLDLFKELSEGLGKNPKITLLEEKDLLVKPLKNSSLNNSKIKSLDVKFHTLNEGIKLIKGQLINSS